MKKILAAWIQQVLLFSSQAECDEYIKQLEQKQQKFRIEKLTTTDNGEVKITVRKQYNNNAFPDVVKEGGEIE